MLHSGVDRFKRQFAHLEEHYGKGERSTPLQRQHASLPRQVLVKHLVETCPTCSNIGLTTCTLNSLCLVLLEISLVSHLLLLMDFNLRSRLLMSVQRWVWPTSLWTFSIILNFTLCRERVCAPKDESKQHNDSENQSGSNLQSPPRSDATGYQNGTSRPNCSARSLLKSASISASKCVVVKQNKDSEVIANYIFQVHGFMKREIVIWFENMRFQPIFSNHTHVKHILHFIKKCL